MSIETARDYGNLLAEIKDRVRIAQYEALRAVNKELVGLYWDIGSMIAQRQKELGWGKSVVDKLAGDLQKEFPGVRGFSVQNLWYMRQFFLAYSGHVKLQPLVGEISWTKHLVILGRCSEDLEREFYIRMTRKFGWSKSVLIHQIENQSYEKTLIGQTNFDKALTPKRRAQAKLAVKDEYTFDFLEQQRMVASRNANWSELWSAALSVYAPWAACLPLLEASSDSRSMGESFFIDLLLFHRRLRCLVAVELKVGEFQPEFVGKMQFYLTALDRQVREKGENPAIGIILCKEKSRTIVEYALRQAKKPIGVAAYRIVKRLPKELKGMLPAPEEIAKLLEDGS